MWQMYNPNPTGRSVGDCAVRAISMALGVDWETAFIMLMRNAYQMGDMPSSDSVWGALLRQNGFYRKAIPSECADCYTVEDFIDDNPKGTFVLGFGGHTACVKNGILYDSWNSLTEIPQFVWYRKESEE